MRHLLILLGSLFTAATAVGQDSLDRNYADELPRIQPLSTTEALGAFTVADGFRIELACAEPTVVDPIAMAFDPAGRLFIIEMRGYSENEADLLGRVRLLEDRDDDGTYEHSTIFAAGLSWPTAITCSKGGVYVGVAPDILFLKDTDGDGVADEKTVAFTGFGRSNVQGLMNTFKWGLDNRIHGAASSSGATLKLKGGEQLVLRGRDFAFDPITHNIAATSGGGQHGLSFNKWGQKFVSQNSNHCQMVMFEDRYVSRNPYMSATGARINIAADGPQADVFRNSPVEPWRIVRTRLRVQKLVPGPVEGGGTAAGYFTGSTGITIYRGHTWPQKYDGWAIVGDVGSNLIHRKRLDPDGVRYIAQRVDQNSEFITSRDIWFRPVQFANGPDGGLYIADMYREVIEHPRSLAPIIKKHLDLTSGRDRGRIYRVVAADYRHQPQPRLDRLKPSELVELIDHPNGWHRETAARLIYERFAEPGDEIDSAMYRTTVSQLEQLSRRGQLPEGRLRALYVLHGIRALHPTLLTTTLDDPHPRVRQHAIRLAEDRLAESAALRNKVLALADDDSVDVRYQLAFTLGELAGPLRDQALIRIIRRDASPYMRIAVQSALVQGAGNVLSHLVSDGGFVSRTHGLAFVESLAAQIGKQQRPEDLASVFKLLQQLQEKPQLAQKIVQRLSAKKGSDLARQIDAATGGQASRLTEEIVKRSVQRALSSDAPLGERLEAVHKLRLGSYASLADTFERLLELNQSTDVQLAALDSLASFDDAAVGNLIVARWPSLSPMVRARAGSVLFSRSSWTRSLLGAVKSKQVAMGDVEPGRLQLLAQAGDPALRQLAQQVLEGIKISDRGEVIDRYQKALTTQGDPVKGQQVFAKVCAACHRIGGVGHELAPNLVTMKARGPEAILMNLLDPNREVNPQYVNYVVITEDGRTLSGMISEETANSITLRRANDERDTILRIDIDELKSTGLSLMPAGLEKQIDVSAMADLLAYLSSI